MNAEPNPAVDQQWLNELGGLHDARILRVTISGDDLVIKIDDLWSNFKDLPQYSRSFPGSFRLVGLSGSPRIDEQVTSESVMDFSVENDRLTKLKIVCFGQYFIEAKGERLVWEPEASI